MSTANPSAVHLETRDDQIVVLTLDQPGSRANTMGQAVLGELEAAVEQLASRSGVRGLIVQSGKPGMFIAGADLKELGAARPDPETTRKLVQRGHALISRFENLSFPTVALIDGACMGAGLELAMGLDFRLAGTHPKAELGQPEVKVGLIPGWGGTQRLTRLIGPSYAAEMICGGHHIKAERARQLGIVFDVVPSERLLDEGVRLLEWARESGAWQEQRKIKQQPVGLTEEEMGFTFAVARAQVQARAGKHYPAPLAALTAIEQGCNLPLEEGLRVEMDQFVSLPGSPTSRNLIAVFFMKQRLQKDPGVAQTDLKPRPVNLVGVVGAGLMGAGIAGAHVRRGIPTVMLDAVPEALKKGVASITRVIESRIKIGRMTAHDLAAALGRLSTSLALASLADRDVVIEAIVEKEEVKTQLYQQVEKRLPAHTILASNTSTISITRMARSLTRPEQFAGLHFFNPVDRMALVEVIRGEKTSDETVVTLVALAKAIGKTPIVVRDCPGFLVNRILFPYINESLVLLQEGASPREVDRAAVEFGMPMGPITLNDLVGLDTSLYAGQVFNTAFADRAAATRIFDELVAGGRLGQKSGAGFYSYSKGSRGLDDPALEPILQRCRTANRSPSAEEMTDRLFLPMLTEASRVLSEGIVREPGDVDMSLILGIGFPPFRGGLLRWADEQGLPALLNKLAAYQSLGPRFHPTEQMKQLAAAGKGFYG